MSNKVKLGILINGAACMLLSQIALSCDMPVHAIVFYAVGLTSSLIAITE